MPGLEATVTPLLRALDRPEQVLDDALGGGSGAGRFLIDIGPHLGRNVVARHQRKRDDRHHRGRDEGEKQLAIETRADLAQQGTRARRPARGGIE